MEHDNKTIEYLAALVSFLMPFYLAVLAYDLFKTKSYNVINMAKIVICASLIGGAYIYLQAAQRTIAIALVLVLVVAIAIAILFGRLFKR
jgi:hypothetical protein